MLTEFNTIYTVARKPYPAALSLTRLASSFPSPNFGVDTLRKNFRAQGALFSAGCCAFAFVAAFLPAWDKFISFSILQQATLGAIRKGIE